MIEVEWTGCYPNLCSGNWIIKYNNKELEIPKNRINKTMETYKKYVTWYFGDSWEIEWEEYEDGLKKEEWIEANKNWVNSMFKKKILK